MAKDDLIRAADEFLQAFNDNNIERVSQMLKSDARYEDLAAAWRADDRDQVLGWFQRLMEDAGELRGTVDVWIVDDRRNVATGQVTWRQPGQDEDIVMPGFIELAITDQGEIARIRDLHIVPPLIPHCPCIPGFRPGRDVVLPPP